MLVPEKIWPKRVCLPKKIWGYIEHVPRQNKTFSSITTLKYYLQW